jgi:hypothetical protein
MRNIIIAVGGIVAGVILQDKFGIKEKAVDYLKDAKDYAVKKVKEAKEKVEENIEEIKEENSTTENEE